MTPHASPVAYLWWLVSRASGIVGLVLISVSVILGLALATKVVRPPRIRPALARLHEHIALTALLAIGGHGLSLLGDHWLKPGLAGITVPFDMTYRPEFTGLGIIGGYLALLLGPSFYLRRRIGARRWRALHRAIVATWLLSVVHALGAGTDAGRPWLRALVLVPAVPIAYLLAVRVLRPDPGRVKAAGGPPVRARTRAGERPRADRLEPAETSGIAR